MRGALWALVLLVLAVSARPLFADDNPFLGTWKLSVAKSNFGSLPMPKSQMRTVAVQGNGVKYSFEGVGADGTPAGADAVTLKRVHAQKIAGTLLKGGKEVGKVTAEVSKDGKVATVKTKGKTVDGKEYSTESVYDKQ